MKPNTGYFKVVATIGVVASMATLALLSTTTSAKAGADRNTVAPRSTKAVQFDPKAADVGTQAVPTIASLTIPGPSTSSSITSTITNLSAASTIGARSIQAVQLNCFNALAKQSLTMDSVSVVTSPAGGTTTVTTGNDADDVGPAIMTYTSFDSLDSASFSLDPDTWDNPSFGATVGNMAGCRVEVIFNGPGNLRGAGTLKLLPNGSIQSAIKQTHF